MAGAPKARAVLLDWRRRSATEQAALEKLFFTSLRMPNGAYKTTVGGRLRDLDERIVELLGARTGVRLLDVGVSSGVTTLDLIERLEAAGMACEAVAADLSVRARLFGAPLGVDVLTDLEGRTLQLAGPWGARGRPSRDGAAGAAFEALGRLLRLAAGPGRDLKLATPRLEGRQDVEIVEQDVFAERPGWTGAFDLVRAANLLNLSYFPPERIRQRWACHPTGGGRTARRLPNRDRQRGQSRHVVHPERRTARAGGAPRRRLRGRASGRNVSLRTRQAEKSSALLCN